MLALDFWLEFASGRTRQRPYFAISKDGKQGDYRGRPCSPHYEELEENAEFVALDSDGNKVRLKQSGGLPIGGHLSAALVELVALWSTPSPGHRLFTRYRDNYFVALPTPTVLPAVLSEMATDLSALLAIQVKFEKVGPEVRYLELRLRYTAGSPVHPPHGRRPSR